MIDPPFSQDFFSKIIKIHSPGWVGGGGEYRLERVNGGKKRTSVMLSTTKIFKNTQSTYHWTN